MLRIERGCVKDRGRPKRVPSVAAPVLMLLAMATAGGPTRAMAAIYHSRESALRMAFAGADTVVARDLFLTVAQSQQIERAAGSVLPSRLVTVYVAMRDTVEVAYGFFETHTVRSLPETLLIVIGPDERVNAVHLLAFHEPSEYEPPPRWLRQFEGQALTEELSLRGGIAGIAGSTLSATAVTAAVRRALAIHHIAAKGAP